MSGVEWVALGVVPLFGFFAILGLLSCVVLPIVMETLRLPFRGVWLLGRQVGKAMGWMGEELPMILRDEDGNEVDEPRMSMVRRVAEIGASPFKVLAEAGVCVVATTLHPLKGLDWPVSHVLRRTIETLPWTSRKSDGKSDTSIEAASMKNLRRFKKGVYIKYICDCKEGKFCDRVNGAWHRYSLDRAVSYCFGKIDKNLKFAKALIIQEYNPRRCRNQESKPRTELDECSDCGKAKCDRLRPWEPLYLDEHMNELQTRFDSDPADPVSGRPVNLSRLSISGRLVSYESVRAFDTKNPFKADWYLLSWADERYRSSEDIRADIKRFRSELSNLQLEMERLEAQKQSIFDEAMEWRSYYEALEESCEEGGKENSFLKEELKKQQQDNFASVLILEDKRKCESDNMELKSDLKRIGMDRQGLQANTEAVMRELELSVWQRA
jgi:hypothetical protein